MDMWSTMPAIHRAPQLVVPAVQAKAKQLMPTIDVQMLTITESATIHSPMLSTKTMEADP
jgi:hypothetical protein